MFFAVPGAPDPERGNRRNIGENDGIRETQRAGFQAGSPEDWRLPRLLEYFV
jgi:hypothetical protein